MRPKTQQQATKEAYGLVDLLSKAFGVRWKANVWHNLHWCWTVYYKSLVIHHDHGEYWAQLVPSYASMSDNFHSDDPIEVIFHLFKHTQDYVREQLEFYERILIDSCPIPES